NVDRRAAACGNFFVQIAGIGVLASNASATTVYLGCILFGLGVGNMISLPGLIVQQEFPKQHFSRIVSLIVAINPFTFACGPGLLGYLQRQKAATSLPSPPASSCRRQPRSSSFRPFSVTSCVGRPRR